MSASETPYAGIVSRTVALAIDAGALVAGFALASGVLGLILSLFTAVEVTTPGAALGAAGLWTLTVASYFVLFWTLAGETPGMRLMQLRVVGGGSSPPRLGQALRRLVGMVLAAVPLFAGYLLVLVDERRRGLHDILAGTVVVYAPRAAGRSPAAGEVASPRVAGGSASSSRQGAATW